MRKLESWAYHGSPRSPFPLPLAWIFFIWYCFVCIFIKDACNWTVILMKSSSWVKVKIFYFFCLSKQTKLKWVEAAPKWISGNLVKTDKLRWSVFSPYLFELYSICWFLGWANSQLFCRSVLGQHWDAYTCPFSLESCWHFTGSCYTGDHHKDNCSCICCQGVWI